MGTGRLLRNSRKLGRARSIQQAVKFLHTAVEKCHHQGDLQEKDKAEFENYRGISLVSYADEGLLKVLPGDLANTSRARDCYRRDRVIFARFAGPRI